MFALALALAASAPPNAPDSNTHFSHTRLTAASPARIWAIWTDVGQWPTWDIALKQATLAGPFAVGTRGTVVPDKGLKATFELVAVEPGRSYTLRTKLPLGALYVKRTLGQAEGQTQFTHEVWFSGFSKGLFGWALGREYRMLLPKVLEAIKAQAEQ